MLRPWARQLPSAPAASRPARRRKWLFLLLFGTVGPALLLFGAYRYATDPVRLHKRVVEALAGLHLEGVSIGEVRYRLGEGLLIRDLSFRPPQSTSFYNLAAGSALRRPGAADGQPPAAPPLVSIRSAAIRAGIGALLTGQVKPRALHLDGVNITLIGDPSAALRIPTTTTPAAGRWALRELLLLTPHQLPAVRMSQVDFQAYIAEDAGLRLVKRALLRVDGEPNAASYIVNAWQEPAGPGLIGAALGEGELRVTCSSTEVGTLRTFLPVEVNRWLDRFSLHSASRLEAEELVFAVTAGDDRPTTQPTRDLLELRRAKVRVDNLRCTLPVEDVAPAAVSADAAYLRISDISGVVQYRGPLDGESGELVLETTGRLRDAAFVCALRLRAASAREMWAKLAAGESQPAGNLDTRGRSWPARDDLLDLALHVDKLELPTNETHPAFMSATVLPGPLRAALRDYVPCGRVNLRVDYRPETGDPNDELEAELEALGVACTYRHFPYAFDDVRGKLLFHGGGTDLQDMTGRHGPAQVTATGRVFNTKSWSGFDLKFAARGVPLDRALHDALPPEYQRLWEQAAPEGTCDVVTYVRRETSDQERGPLKPDVEFDAQLLAGSLALEDGSRLEKAAGGIRLRDRVIELQNLSGQMGQARLQLDGRLGLDPAGAALVNVFTTITDLPVTRTATLGGAAAGAMLKFDGLADVRGHVFEDEPRQRQREFDLRLKSGALTGNDPNAVWTVDRGDVSIRAGQQRLSAFIAHQGEAKLEAAGDLPNGAESATPVQLKVHASMPAIEQVYPQFLPDDWKRIIAALGPRGAGSASVRLFPIVKPEGQQQGAEVELRAAELQSPGFPLPLKDVHAQATVSSAGFAFERGTARYGEAGHIELTAGRGTWGQGALDAEFGVAARELKIDEAFRAGMPPALGGLLDRMGVSGVVDADIKSLCINGSGPYRWDLSGDLTMRDLSLKLGLDLAHIEGTVSGALILLPDGEQELDASFKLANGAIAGRKLAECEGRMSRNAGDEPLVLSGVTARFCDGVVQGELDIHPRSNEFMLMVKLHDVSAAELFPPKEPQPERPRRGRLDGEVWLHGRADAEDSWRGGGYLRISGVTFGQTPVLASVAAERKPATEGVDSVALRFVWEGSRLKIEHVDVRSKDLRLVGEGSWNLREDRLDLTVWGAHPAHWPRVAVLTDLIESAGQELIQFRITGSLDKPQVTAQPLHRMTSALEQLIRELDTER